MTAVTAIQAPCPVVAQPTAGASSPAGMPGLPEPLLQGADPQDALSMLILSMERMSQASASETQARITATRQDIRAQLSEYLHKLREALEAMREAQHSDGFFEGVVGKVADAVGVVAGTLVDLSVDLATQPLDLAVAFAKNPGNPQAFLDAVKNEMGELASNGETAESVRSFTRGAGKLCGAVADFAGRVALALESAALSGKPVWESVKAAARELWGSMQANVLDNPGFWAVAGALGKAAVIAGAAASGGTLGIVAVALLAANEADNRYGLIRELAGDDAARWIKAGLQFAGVACAGLAATGGHLDTTLAYLQGGAAAVEGAGVVYQGVRAIREGDRRADELDKQADIQASLQRMQRLQRLMDDLVALLEEQGERANTGRELGSGLVQTQAAMQAAAIMRA